MRNYASICANICFSRANIPVRGADGGQQSSLIPQTLRRRKRFLYPQRLRGKESSSCSSAPGSLTRKDALGALEQLSRQPDARSKRANTHS